MYTIDNLNRHGLNNKLKVELQCGGASCMVGILSGRNPPAAKRPAGSLYRMIRSRHETGYSKAGVPVR